jgi:hypothetical protein
MKDIRQIFLKYHFIITAIINHALWKERQTLQSLCAVVPLFCEITEPYCKTCKLGHFAVLPCLRQFFVCLRRQRELRSSEVKRYSFKHWWVELELSKHTDRATQVKLLTCSQTARFSQAVLYPFAFR